MLSKVQREALGRLKEKPLEVGAKGGLKTPVANALEARGFITISDGMAVATDEGLAAHSAPEPVRSPPVRPDNTVANTMASLMLVLGETRPYLAAAKCDVDAIAFRRAVRGSSTTLLKIEKWANKAGFEMVVSFKKKK